MEFEDMDIEAALESDFPCDIYAASGEYGTPPKV